MGIGGSMAANSSIISSYWPAEVARQRAAGRPVLAGASLANLKNAGVRELTLLELVRRGVPDSQAAAIIAFRRHGATDAQIISHFAAL